MLEEVNAGITSLLNEYVEIRPSDFVLILYTTDCREGAALTIAALRDRAIKTSFTWMKPLVDSEFTNRVQQCLPADLGVDRRLIILAYERDTISHTAQLQQLLASYDQARVLVFRAMGATPELFTTALRSSPTELSARNAALLQPLMRTSEIQIETEGGTDLSVSLCNSKYLWTSSRGKFQPGAFVVLPAGEVATYSDKINGRFVADFAFHTNQLTDRDSRLSFRPVTVWFENSVAVDIHCADKELEQYIKNSTAVPNGRQAGELGFGTNPSVSVALRHNSHINERRPGIHIGLGQHNQPSDVVVYSCPVHFDLITRGGILWLKDEGRSIDLENVSRIENLHPAGVYEENLQAPNLSLPEDCCGMTRCG